MKKILYIPKPPEWFIERIGKRIYRDSRRYCCPHCKEVEENGLVVHDEMHARYLADVDNTCYRRYKKLNPMIKKDFLFTNPKS